VSVDFREICHGCSASVPNVTITFQEVKVKVQGQNSHTENFLCSKAQLWLKISSPTLKPLLCCQYKMYLYCVVCWQFRDTSVGRWLVAMTMRASLSLHLCLPTISGYVDVSVPA